MKKSYLTTAVLALVLSASGVFAEEKMEHSGHGEMKAVEVKPGTEASGIGVLNSVDAQKGMVNLTHEPMPELGWPTMTMDLPVSKRVDLGSVKPGEKIDFTLKLGRDKQYRVMEITPAK